MRKEIVLISEIVVVVAILACTQLAEAKMAIELAEYVRQSCCNRTTFVSTALIHMHSNCGNIDQAQKEFNRIKNKDAISYSSLITAPADHGRAHEALKLFYLMLKEGIEPNQVTFISLLSACSHAGLVEEGCRYFSMMTEVFRMKPLIEHYSIMFDLLGRAGHLEKAYNILIDGGDVCDAAVWIALLGSWRIHMNVELGEIVARRLFLIEPKNTTNYALLADIYASVRRWGDADKKVKSLGCVKRKGVRLKVKQKESGEGLEKVRVMSSQTVGYIEFCWKKRQKIKSLINCPAIKLKRQVNFSSNFLVACLAWEEGVINMEISILNGRAKALEELIIMALFGPSWRLDKTKLLKFSEG